MEPEQAPGASSMKGLYSERNLCGRPSSRQPRLDVLGKRCSFSSVGCQFSKTPNLISPRKQGCRRTDDKLRLGRQNLGFDCVRSRLDVEPILLAAARMKDKCRAEARDARSGVLANAWIHDAVRSFEQEFVCESLRRAITLRNRVGLEAGL